MLKAGMMDDEGIKQKREQGTPQGGALSPLSPTCCWMIWTRNWRNADTICRYADDCIISVQTMKADERVLASITRYLEGTLKLRGNRQKSEVDKVWNCTCLGYIIGAGGKLWIVPEKGGEV